MQNNLAFTPQQFAADFKVHFTRILGKGHDADVYLVQDRQNKKYAIKCLAQATESNAINLFVIQIIQLLVSKNEIQILTHIQHQNITKMIGFCSDYSCMLLELMPNGSLFKILTQGPLPLAIANGILLKLADAISYIHSMGITHGDLKLDNLLISEQFQVKICDFGFAKQNGTTPIPKDTICGSEGYTAPEIWSIPQDLKKCDIFSLGVIYFIMVTGHPPFSSNNPENEDEWWELIKNNEWEKYWKQLSLGLPLEIKIIIQNLLNADSKERMQLNELIQWLQDKSATSEQISVVIQQRLLPH